MCIIGIVSYVTPSTCTTEQALAVLWWTCKSAEVSLASMLK